MAASGFRATGKQLWPHIGELAGVVTLVLAIVWFMFVPTRLEFDRVEFTIRYLFRRSQTIPWFGLKYYGPGRGVFVLQFETRSFQIFSQAFAPGDWYHLITFLDTRYAECKADGWFGGRGFRWHTK
jgi:hypothetical protein